VLAGLGGDIQGLMREHVDLAVVEGVSPLLGLDATHLETVVGWDDDIALLLEERRSQRSATRVVSVPSSLSTSDLVRLAADPDGFARSLVRPVPAAPAKAARRGTRFHAWVEAHFGVRPLLEPDDLPGAADGLDDDTDEALDSMRAAFLASPWAAREPVAIEVPFSLVLGGRVVPGRIDAVFAETDPEGVTRYEVVDWKTSRAQSADPLQLAVYRVAYAEVVGVPVDQVDAAFVYVRDGSVVRPTGLLSRNELEALLVG
jgi:DNA helicase-2/ATP-dependent DNA helicase PcrA